IALHSGRDDLFSGHHQDRNDAAHSCVFHEQCLVDHLKGGPSQSCIARSCNDLPERPPLWRRPFYFRFRKARPPRREVFRPITELEMTPEATKEKAGEFGLNGVAPWGRRFDEYRAFFALDGLAGGADILDAGGGPASFAAEARAHDLHVI